MLPAVGYWLTSIIYWIESFLTLLGLNWSLPKTNHMYKIMVKPKLFSDLMKFTAVNESLSEQSRNVLF